MTEFWIDQGSSGAYSDVPNEDVVGYISRGDSILIWAIDGASALTDTPFTVFSGESNSGWFSRRLSECLKSEFKSHSFSTVALMGAINQLRREFVLSANGAAVDWSWPVAAAVIMEVRELDNRVQMEVHQYSDCFYMSAPGDLEADVMRRRVSSVSNQSNTWRPASGFNGAKLDALRERRYQQQLNVHSSALTLNPESALSGARRCLEVSSPMHILLGSDGLARLWELYDAMEMSEAMSVAAKSGVSGLIEELRRFEASVAPFPLDGKPVDDACGIHVFLPGVRAGNLDFG